MSITIIRGGLLACSLAATFAFIAGSGSGLSPVVLAVAICLTQLLAVVYLPGVLVDA